MNTNIPEKKELAGKICAAILACVMIANADASPTALGTEPFALSTKIKALPNVMFVLDDSGSMDLNYLPDWAGPYKEVIGDVLTVVPTHRFFNGAYNGVAYNPATYYRPPVMYTNTGALDTTTYPSQTGRSSSAGGSASATPTSPNWQAVKIDGYGIQSTATINLEGNAFFYTTVAGEYCTNAQLRACTASAMPTGSYTFPARLRWCNSAAQAAATTVGAGTSCQASNIADTPTNLANGVTTYTFPRMPSRSATITVNGSGTVTGIGVDGVEILCTRASGSTSTNVASAIAANINACTVASTGSPAVVGYTAVSNANVVTVTAPGATSATPAVTGGATTATAFSAGSVPGSTLLTVIAAGVDSYPYPGTATKGSNRSDCAGATCTYAEEMTNYANWYAYYHTRMQMMKTATSIAFSNVDDKFRVGYFSINNGSHISADHATTTAYNDLVELQAFDGTQKYRWYSQFFMARPYGVTPLRTGLANIGRMYAGKLLTLNNVALADPMQYSCQQNFTILSTDGYWNDASNPKQIDGTSDIGQQDGSDLRPYYDGATQAKTTTWKTKSDQQLGTNTFVVEKRTQQQQKSTTWLDQSTSNLESRTYPLTSSTRNLQARTFQIESTPWNLQRSTYNLTKTTTPLDKKVYNVTRSTSLLTQNIYKVTKGTSLLTQNIYKVTKGTSLLTQNIYNVTKGTSLLTQNIYKVTKGTSLLNKNVYNVTRGTSLLTRNIYNVTATTQALQSSTYKLQSSTRQLQKQMDVSTDGGDHYSSTGWVDASSCVVGASVPFVSKNTLCRYSTAVVVGNLNSCTAVAASPGPTNYTIAQAVTCAYETTPTVASVATCNVLAQGTSSPYSASVTCGYSGTSSLTTGQTSCTARDQTGAASMSGDKVACAYDATPTTTSNLSSCTWVVPAMAAAAPRTDCSYQTATNLAGQTTCIAAAKGTATTNGSVWNTGLTCSYDATPTATTGLSSCTWVVPATAASAPRSDCSYQTATNLPGQTACTVAAKGTVTTSGAVWNTGVACSYDATPTATTGLSSCTWVVPATAASAPKTDCSYQTATNLTGQSACAVAAKGTVKTNGSVWSTGVACSYDATPTATTGLSSCTWVLPATAASAPRTDCSYQTATNLAGQTGCTAAANGTATTNGSVWNTGVACSYDATPATTSGLSSCTWVVPAPSASAPRTDCSYQTATNLAGQTTCTAAANGTATTNGSIWNTGVACAYDATPTATTDLSSCTWVVPAPAASAPKTSCSYQTASNLAGQTACTTVANGTATTNGSVWNTAVACAYDVTPTTTAGQSSCTWVLPSPSASAPRTDCAYNSGSASTLTGQSTCTAVSASTGTANGTLWSGPAVACAYQAAVVTTPVTTCTAGSPSSGPGYASYATCAYAAGTRTTGLNSCTVVAQSPGPTYTGPANACAYSTTYTSADVASCTPLAQDTINYSAPSKTCVYSPTVNSTATGLSSCTDVPQSTVAPFIGPNVSCAYDGTASAINLNAGTCHAVRSTSSPYTGPAVDCVYRATPAVTSVDSCTTVAKSAGPAFTGPAVACAYGTPVVTDSSACTPAARSTTSPYTAEVTCSLTDSGYVPVAPSCTPAGKPPTTVDDTGKIVECRTRDLIGTASSPVPVAACTPGTDTETQVQTNCSVLSATHDVPTSACSEVDAAHAVAPDFVTTACHTTTTTATVTGCVPQVATSAPWQTVTCVPNGGTMNTLADVAAYYYKTDLRTAALGNCTGAMVPPATAASTLCTDSVPDPTNNVPTTTSDPLLTQHMTTFTLGLGASGYMKYSDKYSTDGSGDFPAVKGVSPWGADLGFGSIAADPSNGVCSWQAAGGSCNWPVPASNEQTTIDDLWHAGVNGHGAYFSASDPDSLSTSISSALAGVAAAGGAAASPSISTPGLTPGDSSIFSSTYTTGDWTGELVRKQLDPFTGALSVSNDWAVQGKLDANNGRHIYTFDAGLAVTKLREFTSAYFASNANFIAPHIATAPTGLTQFLCASADICLTATDQDTAHAAGANLVNYLRGDRSNEGAEKDNTKYYRQRQHVLGDLVNAQAVYVSQPVYNYSDAGYSAFVAAQHSRQAAVYVGANDGMLHAFAAKGTAATEALVDAAAAAKSAAFLDPGNAAKATAAATTADTASAAIASDTLIGQELWAYIPSMVIPNLYRLADKEYKDKHRYYVDATPVVADICTSDCLLTTAQWKTILVGGLGRGGRGYYALEITDPTHPKALWEFTDTHLGYSYGNPQIAKLSDGSWVVLVTSGYNNIPNEDGSGGDGVGRLYVLNAATGTQMGFSPIATAGSVGEPSGLAKITAQVLNPASDNTIEAVYGGDLNGHLWRFDVNDTLGAAGHDAQLLAVLKDGSGRLQPITSKPEVGLIAGQKVVFVGTGRYLAASDASDSSQQSLYAIKDSRSSSNTATPVYDNPGGSPRATGATGTTGFVRQVQSEVNCPANTLPSICAQGTKIITSTNHAVDFTSNDGWFVDLIHDAERANTDPALGLSLLTFNTNAPSLVACDVGGNSYQYFMNYQTGGPVYSPGSGTSKTSTTGSGTAAYVNAIVGRLLAPQLASSPILVVPRDGSLREVSGLSGGGIDVYTPPLPASASPARRTAWRELIRGQ